MARVPYNVAVKRKGAKILSTAPPFFFSSASVMQVVIERKTKISAGYQFGRSVHLAKCVACIFFPPKHLARISERRANQREHQECTCTCLCVQTKESRRKKEDAGSSWPDPKIFVRGLSKRHPDRTDQAVLETF